jgi:hypothetical protein
MMIRRSPRLFRAPKNASPLVRKLYRLQWLTWNLIASRVRTRVFRRRLLDVAVTRSPVESSGPPLIIVGVYRRRNGAVMETLLAPPVPRQWDIRLWALDDIHPRLARWTIGQGPGGKFDLINELLASAVFSPDAYVAVIDDDVLLAKGRSLRDVVTEMADYGLEVAQPGHSWYSACTYWTTMRRPFARSTETGFVEIGPIFVISPTATDRMLPFPTNIGMGWSLQMDWFVLAQQGLRFGVIDAVGMVHRDLPNHSYSWMEEQLRFEEKGLGLGISIEAYEGGFLIARRMYRHSRQNRPPRADR